MQFDPTSIPEFFRFGAEEILRRMQAKDATPLGKAQLLKLLFGKDVDDLREKTKHRRIEEVKEQQAQ